MKILPSKAEDAKPVELPTKSERVPETLVPGEELPQDPADLEKILAEQKRAMEETKRKIQEAKAKKEREEKREKSKTRPDFNYTHIFLDIARLSPDQLAMFNTIRAKLDEKEIDKMLAVFLATNSDKKEADSATPPKKRKTTSTGRKDRDK